MRDVDVYAVHPFGLYMARPTPGRAQFHYLESWLLPSLSVRVSVFHFNPGYERDQDFYLDVGAIVVDGQVWRTEDHYLDLVVRTGSGVDLLDVDELFEAVSAGLVTPENATAAVRTAAFAIDGIASNGYDIDAWLSDHEIALTWRAA